jgi:hypothetical protein
MTEAEKNFLEEYTRKCLVGWCASQLEHKTLDQLDIHEPYLSAAVDKGWISEKDGKFRVLAKGFNAAASYLRR